MGCGTALHHLTVLVAVAGACLALVGVSAVITWQSRQTDAIVAAYRREPRVEWTMRLWRSVLVFGVVVVVTMSLLERIHPSATAYAYWAATFIPIGVIDLAHADHCKSLATGKPGGAELALVNRFARRAGSALLVAGLMVAIVGATAAVLTTLC